MTEALCRTSPVSSEIGENDQQREPDLLGSSPFDEARGFRATETSRHSRRITTETAASRVSDFRRLFGCSTYSSGGVPVATECGLTHLSKNERSDDRGYPAAISR